MKDNLSIVILMIVFVMLVVMFPLYNFFERQDDMSYNLALKATTTFVEKVLNYGYMDSDMYDEFVTELSSTGNLYDIEFEAHLQTITKDPDNINKDIYITQTKIEYNNDIFSAIAEPNLGSATLVDRDVKDGMYKLNIGDGFYVKLKNSNTTMAGAIFNSIIATSSKERIVINYGGIVRNNAWYKIDATYNEKVEITDASSSTLTEAEKVLSTSTNQTQLYISNIPKTSEDGKAEPLVVNKADKLLSAKQYNHTHTDDCYVECNGSFELTETTRDLVHSCYFTLRQCAESSKVLKRCPYSSIDGNCNWTITGQGQICANCGQRSTNMPFKLTCIKCGHVENFVFNECLNCRMTYYGKSMQDLEFVIGNHKAMFCDGQETFELYRQVDLHKCNTCDAMYKKYHSYDNECSICKSSVYYDEEFEGVEGQHNIIRICGYN